VGVKVIVHLCLMLTLKMIGALSQFAICFNGVHRDHLPLPLNVWGW
jgi:hypothetical protein